MLLIVTKAKPNTPFGRPGRSRTSTGKLPHFQTLISTNLLNWRCKSNPKRNPSLELQRVRIIKRTSRREFTGKRRALKVFK
uniref:Uncharacterized protein n=2 Tax=Helianthus annuus TaxID=4232 RepID=A0A251U8F9_HELAN